MKFIPVILIIAGFFFSCKHDAEMAKKEPPDCDPDTTFVTYTKDMAPLMTTHCGINTSCHRQTNSDSEISLVSYDDVKAVAITGQLLSSVTHDGNAEPMPFGGQKLSDCNINKIKAWINQGLKEN
jgi:hypothetical protein